MTRLFVNDREVALPPPSLESLEQVINHVETNYLPLNSVIRKVSLDGAPVEASNLKDEIDGDLARRERIEITTCTLNEIALDSIREASSYLERVESLTPSIACSFRDFPGPEAFESLRQLFDGFYWMNMLMDRLESVFAIDMDQTRINGVTLREQQQRFIAVLKQLVTAQEQEDFILIGDLLEFEILPIIPIWQSVLANIARVASGT